MKRFFIFLLSALLILPWACLGEEAPAAPDYHYHPDGYVYTIQEDGSAEIAGYRGEEHILEIPVELDGHPVTRIGDLAFSMASLFRVTLPDTLQSIGDRAFERNFLEEITLPDSLRELGDGIFAENRYQDVSITVHLSPDHPIFEIVDGLLYNKLEHRLLCCLRPAEQVNVPAGTLAIGDYAFREMELSSVTLPEGLKSIGESAFEFTGLAEITLPDSLEIIGKSAFSRNRELTAISLPEHLRSIGDEAFYNCHLAEITLPEGLEHLGSGVFDGCKLTAVRLPDSLTSYTGNPFTGCERLETIEVSPSHPVLEVRDGVLFDKTAERLICYPLGLKKTAYEVPEGTRGIGEQAFHMAELERIILPEGLEVIEKNAFEYCTGLTAVEIPGSVQQIGSEAFLYCDGLEALTFNEGVGRLSKWAFLGCIKLTEVALPDSVSIVEGNPFYSCYELGTFRVSDDHPSLAVIDNVLFTKPDRRLVCYPMTKHDPVYAVPEGTTVIGTGAFFLIDSPSVEIILPDTVTTIERHAFCYGQEGSEIRIRIPQSVTDIAQNAFYSMANLTLEVKSGSAAERYCRENGLSYELTDVK